MRRQGFGKDRQPSRLLLTTFRLSKTGEAGVVCLSSINKISVTQMNQSSPASMKILDPVSPNDSLNGGGFCGCRLIVQNAGSRFM